MLHKFPTVHMVVRNEDRFVWYALQSVLPFAQKVLITDTGSTDKTIDIIRTIYSKKIIFEKARIRKASEVSRIRQEQLEKTNTDWIWVVDGDEIYPRKLCEEIINIIDKKGIKLEGIIVKRIELLGDIYHRQDDSVGSYELFGKKGHFVIRLLNKANISGLHIEGIYPLEGYFDKNNIEVIHRNAGRFAKTHGSLFHGVYLQRSTQGVRLPDTFNRTKFKIEKGQPLMQSAVLPEVFYFKHPLSVPTVTNRRSFSYELMAGFVTPLKKLKRKIIL